MSTALHSTLVVVVPCRDGFAIVADTRTTQSDGRFVDGDDKVLLVRDGQSPIMFCLSGTYGFAERVDFGNGTRTVFDGTAVVLAKLSEHPLEKLSAESVADTARMLRAGFQGHFATYPQDLPHFQGGCRMCFLQATKEESILESVELVLAGNVVELGAAERACFHADMSADLRLIGEVQFVERHVFGGAGIRFLSQHSLDMIATMDAGRLRVGDVSAEAAAALASNIVSAAERTATLIVTVQARS